MQKTWRNGCCSRCKVAGTILASRWSPQRHCITPTSGRSPCQIPKQRVWPFSLYIQSLSGFPLTRWVGFAANTEVKFVYSQTTNRQTDNCIHTVTNLAKLSLNSKLAIDRPTQNTSNLITKHSSKYPLSTNSVIAKQSNYMYTQNNQVNNQL